MNEKVLLVIAIVISQLSISCSEDDDSASVDCLNQPISTESSFNFTGEQGELGVAGTFHDVYLTETLVVLNEGEAGSNSIEATITINLQDLLNVGPRTYDLSIHEAKIRVIGDATYSTIYTPQFSPDFTGGTLTIHSIDKDCSIISGNYEINSGRFNSSLNRDLRLGISGNFNSIGLSN